MKPILSEKKWKKSRNPLLGTLTRSKSQVYAHLNRSGQHRTDAFAFKLSRRRPVAQLDVCRPTRRKKKSSIPTAGNDSTEVTMSCIKDLRSRRVFSEPLVVIEKEEKNLILSGTSIEQHGCEDPNLSGSMEVFSEEKEGEIKGFGRGEEILGFQKADSPCNHHGLDDLSPVMSNPNRIIDEGNIQTTPPDSDIFSLQKDGENRLNGGRDVLLAQYNGSPNTKLDSIPRSKLVLNPCRLRVFKTPSSLSYRRLLPYLQDIAKQNSSTIESQTCPSSKSDIILEANPTVGSQIPQNSTDFTCTTKATGVSTDRHNQRLSPSNSPPRDSLQADQVSSAKRLKVFKSPSSVSYRRLLPFLKTVAKNKSCELEIKSCPKLESVFEEKPVVQSHVPLVHANIHMSGFEDGTSKSLLHTASQKMLFEDGSNQEVPCSMQTSGSTKLIYDNPTTINCPKSTLPTRATDGQNERLIPSITPQGELSYGNQVLPAEYGDSTPKISISCNDMDQTTTSALADGITLYQRTLPSRDLPCLEPCTISSAKGILKRNSGGCRGLCTCLSCSSFRLHAERAFEFSSNQLQDTEEIVMGLMKELSQVRVALEMFSDDSSNSQGSSKINKFEEICASSLKAEELARIRLKEMNEELFFHCRMKSLQRPRVNFAIEIEEKRL